MLVALLNMLNGWILTRSALHHMNFYVVHPVPFFLRFLKCRSGVCFLFWVSIRHKFCLQVWIAFSGGLALKYLGQPLLCFFFYFVQVIEMSYTWMCCIYFSVDFLGNFMLTARWYLRCCGILFWVYAWMWHLL